MRSTSTAATVIPGLIESCDHIVSFGNYRPGYHTVLENATSIAEIQAILAMRRAEVPPGEWITALGAWNAFTMFAERRLPTRAELDAAVPDRPVLLYQTTIGPAVTNTAGMAWFAKASMRVTIGEDGNIAAGSPSTTPLYLLRLTQTRDQRRRTHLEAWALLSERRPDRAHRPGRAFRLRQALAMSWATRSLQAHASIQRRHSIISTISGTGTRGGAASRGQ